MSLDDHELEDRLRAHLHQQADAIHIEPAFRPDQRRRTLRRAAGGSSAGLTLVAAAAVVIVAALGVAGVSGLLNRPETQEVATTSDDGQLEDGQLEDGASDAADRATVEEEPAEEETAEESLATTATRFEVLDITDASAPGAFSGYDVDDGAYILLSTAPGRVSVPDVSASQAELDAFDLLLKPRTFYVLDPSLEGEAGRTWQTNTVADRFISGFEISDGLLYAVSTGLINGDVAPAIGVSDDRGASWAWNETPELGGLDALDLDSLGDELVIAGFTPASVAQDEAYALIQQAGFDLAPEQLLFATNNFFEYLLPAAEADQADYTLGGTEAIRRVWWNDIWVDTPASWDPLIALYRYDLADQTLTELDLSDVKDEHAVEPTSDQTGDPTSSFLALNRNRTGSVEQISFEAWPDPGSGQPNTWALTGPGTDQLSWTEVTAIFDTSTGSAGEYQFMVDTVGNLPRLQRAADGPWETVTAEELVPGQGVVSGPELVLEDSRYGLFANFNGYNGPSTIVATIDGETWQAFDTDFEMFSVHDGDGEVLLVGERWADDPDQPGMSRSFTSLYRLTPADS